MEEINTLSDSLITPMSKIKPLTDKTFKRILFIKPSSLGDIFNSFPAFYLLRKSCPNCKIDWLISKNLAPVLKYIEKDLESIIIFNRSIFKTIGAIPELKKLITSIRKEEYDLAIDLQGLLRSSLMAFIAKAKHKIGSDNTREKIASRFYNKKIFIPENITHAIEKNTFIISTLLQIPHIVPDFKLESIKEFREQTIKLLNNNNIDPNKFILFAPGARWKTKRWTFSHFARVADLLYFWNPNIKVVIIGTKSERQIADRLMKSCKQRAPISLVGKTSLVEMIEIIGMSKLLLTNDSGPMHIAAAMRKPVHAIFGPTDPQKTGPYWEGNHIYQAINSCTKCLKKECAKQTMECLNHINPEDVAKEIIKELTSFSI